MEATQCGGRCQPCPLPHPGDAPCWGPGTGGGGRGGLQLYRRSSTGRRPWGGWGPQSLRSCGLLPACERTVPSEAGPWSDTWPWQLRERTPASVSSVTAPERTKASAPANCLTVNPPRGLGPVFWCDWPGRGALWWGDGGFCAAAWTWDRAALRGASSLQPSPTDTLQAGTRLKAAHVALPQGRAGTGTNGDREAGPIPSVLSPAWPHTPLCPGAPRQPPGPRPPKAPSEPTSRAEFLLDAASSGV